MSFTDIILDVIRHVIKIETIITNHIEYVLILFFSIMAFTAALPFAEIYYDPAGLSINLFYSFVEIMRLVIILETVINIAI